MEREMMIINSNMDSASIIGAGTHISIRQNHRELWAVELEDAAIAGEIECYGTRAEAVDALKGLIDAYRDGAAVYVMPAPAEGEES